jgi:hypothetical protein
MSRAKTTTNHDEIRNWAEKRGGHPALVRTGERGGVLRIDFDEPGGNDDDRLERVGWDEFFRVFDQSDVAFLHDPEGDSRFNKFVERKRRAAESVDRQSFRDFTAASVLCTCSLGSMLVYAITILPLLSMT